MTSTERREFRETRTMRTVSPVRHTGSSQNLSQFDNNLDNLLEDLQSSVSRPGSSLGNAAPNHTYRETSRIVSNSNASRDGSLNRVTHLSAANPAHVMSSDDVYNYTSPDGTKSVRSYKKESYSYSTSGKDGQPESRMQNNINQLDSLLDDLQQARSGTLDKNRGPNYTSGIDPGLIETSKTKITSGKRTVQRELVYDESQRSGSLRSTRSPHRSDRENSLTREVTYTNDGTYGDIKPLRQTSPARSNTSTLNKQKTVTVTNVHEYPPHVVQTTDPAINAEILAQLDPNLVPSGNTKVTTTIKTYTYEIPGTGYPAAASPTSDTEKYVYSPNQSQSVPSNSFVYNKADSSATHTTTTSTKNIRSSPPASRVHGFKEAITIPSPETFPRNTSNTYAYNETTRHEGGYHPGSPGWNTHGSPPGGPGNKTYLYKETTTTKNLNQNGYPVNGNPPNRGGPSNHTYIINETNNTTTRNNNESPYPHGYPPNNQHDPAHTTIIYKTDTHHNNYGPSNQQPYPYNQTEVFDPNNPPYPHSGKPHDPNINITYKYSSQHTSSNRYKGGYPPSNEAEALLPQKFPTNEIDGPPKRLDDLMATIGREPPNNQFNAGYNAREVELAEQRRVDNLKQVAENASKKDVKDLPKTRNVSGPPVYYPPGHEMFAKKEEGEGAWRAQGAYARESGKYKYEAESKSKTKSSSGAAIVPVCLPLCCGLPCVIL